jgi:hypothetical protein
LTAAERAVALTLSVLHRGYDAGIAAEVHDDAAVWWCRLGSHAVAVVGALGA